ncbi:MAG: ATP-binding cassette domain-containing protein [Acidobacteriia bacterium]|nr:ATP-binding cassette domain-containing protein [Terriglobia bacterium]
MSPNTTASVELRNVTKAFASVTAVDDLTLTVPEGSVYGFIGPNGSGKSTTMRMIVNIIRPDRGAIRVFGRELSGTSPELIGYLPEERGLYRKMEVRSLLEFYSQLRGGRKAAAEIDHWLKKFDLAGCASLKLESLSKGMSQKVQFIAAVAPAPRLLILDEPFTGLDPVSRDVLQDAILELRAAGTTIILSTHDMAVAEIMCDYIFMIFQGRKVLDGTLAAIQDQYGADTLRVTVDGGAAMLAGLPGIERVRDLGRVQEIRVTPGADPQQTLSTLLERTKITSFSLTKPSLHEIFVRIAGPAAEAAQHA